MGDPLEEARQAGDVPQAPGFLGWASAVGAATGVVFTAGRAPWTELAAAGWGLGGITATMDAATAVVLPCVTGGAVGALVGLTVGAAGVGALSPGLRVRTRGRAPSRGWGLAALFFIALGALLVPQLAAYVGQGDPGRLLAYTPLAVLALGALALTPVVLLERARAARTWRERLVPEGRRQRDADEMAPEMKAAFSRRARAVPVTPESLSVVVTADEYAVGLVFTEGRAPRVARHGGLFLRRAAVAVGVPVIDDPSLAARLAMIPTGEPAPEDAWPQLRVISKALR